MVNLELKQRILAALGCRLAKGKIESAHEGKILLSCSLISVVEGKPCAFKGVDLIVTPPLLFQPVALCQQI